MAKILFIQNYNEPLSGIMSVASYLKKKHQVAVAKGSFADITSKLQLFRPDLVGIHALSIDHNWALKVAESVKLTQKKVLVLLGGPHPTFYREIVRNKYVDAICIGEGERAVENLLNAIDRKEEYINIRSIWIKQNGQLYKNEAGTLLAPKEIPIPDIAIYNEYPNILKSGSLGIVCSRGCPFDCSFCSNYTLNKMYGGRFFRFREIDDIIKEITQGLKARKIKTIIFQDDIFGMNNKWLDSFLRQYRQKVNLPFYCLLRCDLISERLVDQLKAAGCFRVGVGVESGDEHIRIKVLNKKLSNQAIEKAVNILKDKSLEFHTFNMFGLPQEDFRSAMKTLNLNIRLRPDPAKSIIFQPFPGTKFFSEEVKKSILSPDFSMFKINYKYSNDAAKIQRLQKLFMIIVKFPIIKYLVPLLVRLPLDGFYDKISQKSWSFIYYRRITRENK